MKIDKSNLIIWGSVCFVLIYILLSRWGLLGGYLQASPFIYLGLAIYLTNKISRAIDNFYIKRIINFPYFWIYKLGKSFTLFLIFLVIMYITYFSTMDRILISNVSSVPIQVLLPCTYHPNPPELEEEIRKVWKISKFHSIDDFCNSENDVNNSDN